MNNALKSKALVSVIVGLIASAIVVLSIFTTLNSSFFKMPMFTMILGEGEVADAQDSFDKYIEEAEDALDSADDAEIEEFEEEYGMSPKKFIKLMKTPSLNSLVKASKLLVDKDTDVDEDVVQVFTLFRTIIVVWALIVLLFTLLGALCKTKALTIVGMILSILYFVLFAGFLMLILYFVAAIAHIVTQSAWKKAKKAEQLQAMLPQYAPQDAQQNTQQYTQPQGTNYQQ